MSEKDEANENILIDDEEKAKQEFLEELRNKNLEETIQLKKIQEAINQKLKEKEDEKKRKEEAEAVEKANADAQMASTENENADTENKDANTETEDASVNTISEETDVDTSTNVDEEKSEDKGTEIVKAEEPALAVTSEAKASLLNMEKKESSLLSKILTATVVDTIAIAAISTILVLLFNGLLRLLAGYYVADYEGVYIIAFLIVMILYPIIMQTSKYKKTLGQKLSKIHIKEGEE